MQRWGAAASLHASVRIVASIGGQDALGLGRLPLPLGQGVHEQVQGIKGAQLDMVGKGECRWLMMDKVEVAAMPRHDHVHALGLGAVDQ